jgi:uncharacterized protein (TIGR03086 family)
VTFDQQRSDYVAALNWVTDLARATPPECLDLPTPCAEFDVRTLIGHLIGTAERGLGTAERRSTRHVPHVVADVRDEELGPTYAALATRAAAAWAGLSGDDPVQAPWGECPALDAARGYTIETLTHGWDLAVATGRPADGPSGVADRCLTFAESVVPERLRGVMYDTPIHPGHAASSTERLANLLGHQRVTPEDLIATRGGEPTA